MLVRLCPIHVPLLTTGKMARPAATRILQVLRWVLNNVGKLGGRGLELLLKLWKIVSSVLPHRLLKDKWNDLKDVEDCDKLVSCNLHASSGSLGVSRVNRLAGQIMTSQGTILLDHFLRAKADVLTSWFTQAKMRAPICCMPRRRCQTTRYTLSIMRMFLRIICPRHCSETHLHHCSSTIFTSRDRF